MHPSLSRDCSPPIGGGWLAQLLFGFLFLAARNELIPQAAGNLLVGAVKQAGRVIDASEQFAFRLADCLLLRRRSRTQTLVKH